MEKLIYVYENWSGESPILLGRLYVNKAKRSESYSFEYDESWLRSSDMKFILDPDLALYRGRQYTPLDKGLFGLFSDSCPDRWGRLLMQRREAIVARKEGRKPDKLNESDYLLGVYDAARMGALRFSLDENGLFESSDESLATPPWVSLRKLESASIAFENDESGLEERWLKQLLAPGSSLGGARPKATVQDVDGSLWIAKFPSKHDETNSGAWEMTIHELARMCGLNVPEAQLETFSPNGATFIVKRFDRDGTRRIHFSSAMTLLGQSDGTPGNSYLDMVDFIKMNGSSPKADLIELWKRVVFNMAVTNSDDHLRNHGFILTNTGWKLSPLYDVNPVPYSVPYQYIKEKVDVRITDTTIEVFKDHRRIASHKRLSEIIPINSLNSSPALLTKTSILPYSFFILATALLTACESATLKFSYLSSLPSPG